MRFDNAFLKDKINELYFIELKKDMVIGGNTISKELPLPIMMEDIAHIVKNKQDDFKQRDLIHGILFLNGLDPDFKHADEYMGILESIDSSIFEIVVNDIFNNVALDNEQKFIMINGVFNYGEQTETNMSLLGRLAYDLHIEKNSQDYEKLYKDIFTQMARTNPENAMPYYYLGFFYYNRSKFIKAKKSWAKGMEIGFPEMIQFELIEIIPKLESKIVFEEGYEQILKGRYDEGLEKLLSIKDEYSEWWNLMFFIGLGYRFKEDYKHAVYYFDRALQLNEGDINILNELGICHTMIGDNDRAIEIYQEALTIMPQNHELVCNIGIALYNKGQIADAKKFIDKAIELNPNDEISNQWKNYLATL